MRNKKREQMRKWLRRYRIVKKELVARQRHLEDFIRDMYNPLKAVCSDGQPRGKGTTSDQTFNAVASLERMERTYETLIWEMEGRINVLKTVLKEIDDAINTLNEYERCVLYHRFIMGIHWKDIPAYIGYEQAQCTRCEVSGLDKLIKKMINNDKV